MSRYLPAEDQAEAAGQTFTTANGIIDDYCAQVLNGLAPYLPSDLLGEALAVTPKTSAAVLAAALKQARSVPFLIGNTTLVNPLRNSLDETDRRACLGLSTGSRAGNR